MNFKRPFSFKAGCWLTACRLAKHSWEKEERSAGGFEGEKRRRCWQSELAPRQGGYWMSLTMRDNRALCMGSQCRSIPDLATRFEKEKSECVKQRKKGSEGGKNKEKVQKEKMTYHRHESCISRLT